MPILLPLHVDVWHLPSVGHKAAPKHSDRKLLVPAFFVVVSTWAITNYQHYTWFPACQISRDLSLNSFISLTCCAITTHAEKQVQWIHILSHGIARLEISRFWLRETAIIAPDNLPSCPVCLGENTNTNLSFFVGFFSRNSKLISSFQITKLCDRQPVLHLLADVG